MLCAKFGWNWPSGYWEEDFFLFRQCILAIYHPLEKSGTLHLNKPESPSPKNCAKYGWNWTSCSGEDFVNVILLFRNYLPLEKGGPLIWTNLNLFTKGCFVLSLVEIGPVVMEKKIKIWKVYDNNDNDN